MISLGNNTFKQVNSFVDDAVDYNVLHIIRDDNNYLSERLTYHQFISTLCDTYNYLIQNENSHVYSTFNDERFILIALAGMISGKTVLTRDDKSVQDILYINSLTIVDNIDNSETLKLINERIVSNDVGDIIFYTSGSTGTMKRIHLSWYNIMATVHSFRVDPYVDYSGFDSILHCLPHSHVYGFIMELLFITFGSRVYYTAPSTLYQSYLTIKPTVMPIVPAILNKLYESHLPLKLNLLICAGAPLRSEIAEFYGKTCRQILKGYGTTESAASLTLSVNPYDDGICTAANIIRIADDGEVLVKGLSVAKHAIASDGWYYTNDIVSITSDNRLRIVGRKNNTIKLQQGEFINLDELSILYTSNSIDTVVYATPLDRYPNAIVYIDNTINKDDIPKIFNDIHERNNRKGYERINNITIKPLKDMSMINSVKPDYRRIREEAINGKL